MRHLDRSNGQSHRPLRSGETPAFRFCPCRGCAQFSTEIFQESGMFSAPEKHPSKTPQLTSNPPQLHHKKPSRNHAFSQKPPEKTPLHHAEEKPQNYFITLIGTPSGILISNWSFSIGWFKVSFRIVMVRLY